MLMNVDDTLWFNTMLKHQTQTKRTR